MSPSPVRPFQELRYTSGSTLSVTKQARLCISTLFDYAAQCRCCEAVQVLHAPTRRLQSRHGAVGTARIFYAELTFHCGLSYCRPPDQPQEALGRKIYIAYPPPRGTALTNSLSHSQQSDGYCSCNLQLNVCVACSYPRVHRHGSVRPVLRA